MQPVLRTVVWALAGLWSVAAPAKPPEGPQVDWDGGVSRRYLLKADVVTPNILPMPAAKNIDGLLLGFRVDMVVSCKAEMKLGKRGWALRCDVDDASIRGRPDPGTAGKVAIVAEEWTGLLKQGWIQVDALRNGRTPRVDLEGIPKSRVREQTIQQVMRELVVRAWAPLDVELPKQQAMAEGLTWTQRNSLVLGLPSLAGGSVGGAQLQHQVAARTPGGWLTAFTGRGTLGWGVEQGESLRDLMMTEFSGSFLYDPDAGAIRQAQHIGSGEPTAGSAQTTAKGAYYTVSSSAVLLDDDDPTPSMPPPGEY